MDILERLLEHERWVTTPILGKARDLTDAQLDQEFDIGHRVGNILGHSLSRVPAHHSDIYVANTPVATLEKTSADSQAGR